MKTFKKVFNLFKAQLGLAAVTMTLSLICGSALTLAAGTANCVGGDNSQCAGGPSGNVQSTTPTSTSTGACKDTTNAAGNVTNANIQKCLDQSPIVHDLQTIVDFLSALVGIVVIAVIILGGVQYSLAGDNATATGAAKTRITNGLVALAAFIFTFAFLQWLIPGGIFG